MEWQDGWHRPVNNCWRDSPHVQKFCSLSMMCHKTRLTEVKNYINRFQNRATAGAGMTGLNKLVSEVSIHSMAGYGQSDAIIYCQSRVGPIMCRHLPYGDARPMRRERQNSGRKIGFSTVYLSTAVACYYTSADV